MVADERVLFGSEPDEVAVVHPYLLDELELPGQARAHEDEDDAALDSVVFENTIGQLRAVGGSAPHEALSVTPLVQRPR
ncbi:hypothetical protein [Streptomyces aureus]|uniref:Uncharacterized protein n=1 Tax=Streptomyces aureus TaxID=193461 RepID=A0ABV4T2J6_9ACTN